VCAISTVGPLPVDPADVAADEGAHARLEALCRNISPAPAAAPIKARQACFRPVTEDGLPFIGAVPGVDGAYVATGHSVWGMLNAPATGEAMSELLLDGAARHVDLAPFAPGRLPPLDPARLRGRRTIELCSGGPQGPHCSKRGPTPGSSAGSNEPTSRADRLIVLTLLPLRVQIRARVSSGPDILLRTVPRRPARRGIVHDVRSSRV
jgi:hypothetical protein